MEEEVGAILVVVVVLVTLSMVGITLWGTMEETDK